MDVINDTNPKKDYTFHLAAFNGPLELLMHLIEKNKIDIYDIPIAELTRQYLDYLEAMREMDMEVTSAFLVMAATLLQIKSRMMLPKKTKSASKASSNVFARLLAAGQRLLAVINKNEGLPNKELARFADQINSLCDKWER